MYTVSVMATCSFPDESEMQYACIDSSIQHPSTLNAEDISLPQTSSEFDPGSPISKEEWEQILCFTDNSLPLPSNGVDTLVAEPVVMQDHDTVLNGRENSNHVFVWNGLDLLEVLQTVKQADPGKAALKLMEALFTDEEMSFSCFKPGSRRPSKPALDVNRVKLIEDCLLQYYGDKYSSMKKDITERCNQKCRDRSRDKNKPRRAKRQQAQEQIINMSLVESKLDSLLDGQRQLMQAVFGLPFPAIHYDEPITESFSGLSDDLLDPSWNLDIFQN